MDVATLKNGRNIFSVLKKTRLTRLSRLNWSREWGSNPRPTVYDTVALPTELSRPMLAVNTL